MLSPEFSISQRTWKEAAGYPLPSGHPYMSLKLHFWINPTWELSSRIASRELSNAIHDSRSKSSEEQRTSTSRPAHLPFSHHDSPSSPPPLTLTFVRLRSIDGWRSNQRWSDGCGLLCRGLPKSGDYYKTFPLIERRSQTSTFHPANSPTPQSCLSAAFS